MKKGMIFTIDAIVALIMVAIVLSLFAVNIQSKNSEFESTVKKQSDDAFMGYYSKISEKKTSEAETYYCGKAFVYNNASGTGYQGFEAKLYCGE